jgi:hypothetical protein
MIRKIILLDFSIPELNRYPQVGLDAINAKYIGISWLTDLIQTLSLSGYYVVGVHQPKQYMPALFRGDCIHVISNRVNKLINPILALFRGNTLYINLESPLFEFELYNCIIKNSLPKRAFYIGFSWSAPKSKQVRNVTYPGEPPFVANNELSRVIPYSMICTNNFKSKKAPFPSIRYPWRVSNYFIDIFHQRKYPAYSFALDNSTSTTKIAIIESGRLKGLHLYGRGWDSLDFVPKKYRQRLRSSLNKVYKGPTPHKEDVLKSSVFSFAIENTRIDGYITEKIIDCFRFGAIPVYFGAPNITDYFPAESFVNGTSFCSMEDLFAYLDSLSDDEIKEMRKSGATALVNYLSTWSNSHIVDLVINRLQRRVES